jgi:hypothetical protein
MSHSPIKHASLRAWILLSVAWLLLGATRCTDVNISTDVDASQKISDTAGNFDGDLDSGDRFGSALAVIGDLEVDGVIDLAVGAPFDDDGGRDRGAVWVLFMDPDGNVDLERKISAESGDFNGDLDNDDHFGSALAAPGDIDGDGILDLAVGAPLDDDGGDDRGAVWLLFLDAAARVREARKISDRFGDFELDLNNGDHFGAALAAPGDIDGDGINDLVVGAPLDGDGGTATGAVWILFMNTDGTVRDAQKISHDEGDFGGDLDNDDRFGSAVAGIGDLDGDGVIDIVVGAPNDADGGLGRGAVWVVFLNQDGTVRTEQKISQTEGEFDGQLDAGDQFGSALADIGDLDGDGVADLAVGARLSDGGGVDRGAVWVLFMDTNGEVVSELRISDIDANFDRSVADNSEFGSAIAGLGNLDNSGARDIAIGTPLDDDGATDEGAVWILFMERTKTEAEKKFFID